MDADRFDYDWVDNMFLLDGDQALRDRPLVDDNIFNRNIANHGNGNIGGYPIIYPYYLDLSSSSGDNAAAHNPSNIYFTEGTGAPLWYSFVLTPEISTSGAGGDSSNNYTFGVKDKSDKFA